MRRAFHCTFKYKSFVYIIGGYSFSTKNNINSLISRLDLENFEWEHHLDRNYSKADQIPKTRYAHSCALDIKNVCFSFIYIDRFYIFVHILNFLVVFNKGCFLHVWWDKIR